MKKPERQAFLTGEMSTEGKGAGVGNPPRTRSNDTASSRHGV